MLTFAPKTFSFTVDLAGLIDLMGTALYQHPNAAIRELIQNAHDSIVRRRNFELVNSVNAVRANTDVAVGSVAANSWQGQIRFTQNRNAGTLTIEDNGIGLNPDEAEKYLSTLGVGITGMLRRSANVQGESQSFRSGELIGQFGIGLLSAFLLCDRIVVESLRLGDEQIPICWEADSSTVIKLSRGEKTTVGTKITLYLRPEQKQYAESEEVIEEAIRQYADFIQIPIFLNNHEQRINLAQPIWFEPEADEDELILALENWFHETPLCVIPIRVEKPITIQGALYISPQRVPGFTDEARVATTIRRMIISRRIQGLMPSWSPFVRGVLELPDCRPTASREELVRDENFDNVKQTLEQILFKYFEQLAREKPAVWEALLNWHRYTLAGAALENSLLRRLLRETYRFATHRGKLTFMEILDRSAADSLFEDNADYVIWYHGDRRQEAAIDAIFADLKTPCVHATMMFEEALLIEMANDTMLDRTFVIDCRVAVPGTKGFSKSVLGANETILIDDEWEEFFESIDAKIFYAQCDSMQPVFAFLNERYDLMRTLDALKKGGDIPSSFQRMIDKHLEGEELPRNEILLNRRHPLVDRALEKSTTDPLAAVLRVLVFQAVQSAGATLSRNTREQIENDLEKIAEKLV
ncbi:MAG: ATP-binding protein [Planctomycetaceae bacterium]|jgi:HSP90 family molecular chaperone|nr:ATP-binding protein [Planctomycetaceae bacterium]